MELKSIEISVMYKDEDGDTQIVNKESKSFESAEENLGKLERFLESLKNV